MSGTKAGGLKASMTNKQLHGDDFYARIGQKGGKVKSPLKGFGSNPTLAKLAGKLGGMKSKRGRAKK